MRPSAASHRNVVNHQRNLSTAIRPLERAPLTERSATRSPCRGFGRQDYGCGAHRSKVRPRNRRARGFKSHSVKGARSTRENGTPRAMKTLSMIIAGHIERFRCPKPWLLRLRRRSVTSSVRPSISMAAKFFKGRFGVISRSRLLGYAGYTPSAKPPQRKLRLTCALPCGNF